MLSKSACALLCAALMIGCATRPRVALAPVDGEQQLSSRESALFERTHFSLNGRIAVSNGGDGGSGRFFWEQRGQAFTLRFVAPVGAQNWRIEAQPGQALLIESSGAVRVAATADELLRRELGWRVPSQSLRYWILGMRAPESEATPGFDESGNLTSLKQAGWQIDYLRFDQSQQPSLPTKLYARSGDNEVRISVRAWEFQSP